MKIYKRKYRARRRQYRQVSPLGYRFRIYPLSNDRKLWMARVIDYPMLIIKFHESIIDDVLKQAIDQSVNTYLNKCDRDQS